jgi:hypothetical protein
MHPIGLKDAQGKEELEYRTKRGYAEKILAGQAAQARPLHVQMPQTHPKSRSYKNR